jgi:hypothetical protein
MVILRMELLIIKIPLITIKKLPKILTVMLPKILLIRLKMAILQAKLKRILCKLT